VADERSFERLARVTQPDPADSRAPARLKSRVYSALVATMADEGPLMSLAENREHGCRLCVFEHAVAVLPISADLKCRNPCRVCHARILGERLDDAPIFWPGCPYSEFHKG
jgi:hypothetical protein